MWAALQGGKELEAAPLRRSPSEERGGDDDAAVEERLQELIRGLDEDGEAEESAGVTLASAVGQSEVGLARAPGDTSGAAGIDEENSVDAELDRILRWLEELERAELTKLLRRPPRDTVAEATSAARAAAASRNLDAWLLACRGAAAGNAPEPRDARRLCKTALRSLAAREFVALLAPPPPRRADACRHGFSSVASTHGACCYALEALSALRLPPEQLKQASQMQLVLCRGLADACLRLAEPRLDVAEHAIALARERCDTAEEAACARLLAAGTRLLARRLTRPSSRCASPGPRWRR